LLQPLKKIAKAAPIVHDSMDREDNYWQTWRAFGFVETVVIGMFRLLLAKKRNQVVWQAVFPSGPDFGA
jgi:hypothetical protein